MAVIAAFAWKYANFEPSKAVAYGMHTIHLSRKGSPAERRDADITWESATKWSIKSGLDSLKWGVECIQLARGGNTAQSILFLERIAAAITTMFLEHAERRRFASKLLPPLTLMFDPKDVARRLGHTLVSAACRVNSNYNPTVLSAYRDAYEKLVWQEQVTFHKQVHALGREALNDAGVAETPYAPPGDDEIAAMRTMARGRIKKADGWIAEIAHAIMKGEKPPLHVLYKDLVGAFWA